MKNNNLSKKNNKSQSAMEFLIIISFIVMLILPGIFYFLHESRNLEKEMGIMQADKILKIIKINSEKVYYSGQGSKIEISFTLPNTIENASLDHNILYYKLRTQNGYSDVFQILNFNITGYLPKTQGSHTLIIESKGDYVLIS
jgi:uncharacterized protein (UPF0333 family)